MSVSGSGPAQCVDVSAVVDAIAVPGTRNIYRGFTLEEAAGAVAKVYVREATSTGKILDVITFAANEGISDFYESGKVCNGAIYWDVLSGDVTGSIFFS